MKSLRKRAQKKMLKRDVRSRNVYENKGHSGKMTMKIPVISAELSENQVTFVPGWEMLGWHLRRIKQNGRM